MKRTFGLLACLAASPAAANLEITFPGPARESLTETLEFTSYKMPIGPFVDGEMQTLVAEGPLKRTAWHLELSGGTTLGVMDNLRQQIEGLGFELLYECETRECGGFDFRFQTEILPEPDMHIDLGDYRFLSAQRLGGSIPEYLSLIVSRSQTTAFVQITQVGTPSETSLNLKSGTRSDAVQPAVPTIAFGSVVEELERNGSAVLDDLKFATGSSKLGEGKFLSLIDLADYLEANPSRSVVLVGHTDAEGSLQGNITLSRKRAQSVADKLISEFGVPAKQVSANGVGFLAPRANNLSDEGRALNRRVEVVLTSTQ